MKAVRQMCRSKRKWPTQVCQYLGIYVTTSPHGVHNEIARQQLLIIGNVVFLTLDGICNTACQLAASIVYMLHPERAFITDSPLALPNVGIPRIASNVADLQIRCVL
jgi:hypothetical protein